MDLTISKWKLLINVSMVTLLMIMVIFYIPADLRISEPSTFNPFSLSSNGTFAPPHTIPMPLLPMTPGLPVTSDLHARGQMVDQGSVGPPVGLSDRFQGLNSLHSIAASTQQVPESMEASNMGVIPNQTEPQAHQPCKYDLLSSVPCKS